MATRSGRMYMRFRERMQAFFYWLGPTYCILSGAFILFGSFIIQLLTSIGVPYIKAFDFFRFDLSNFTFIELGMWAACNGRKAFIIPSMPSESQPEQFNCPPAMWGWKSLQYAGITDAFFDHNLPKALILHPISCVFTFMAMVTALVTMKRQRQHFLLPVFSFFSCLFALLSFVIDLATFVPARGKLMGPRGFEVLGMLVTSTTLGPAFWLSMCCFILDIIGNFIIIAGYGIWRYQRTSRQQRRLSGDYSRDIEMKAGSRLSSRNYFNKNGSVASLSNHSPYDEKVDDARGANDHDSIDALTKGRRSRTSVENEHDAQQEVTHEVLAAPRQGVTRTAGEDDEQPMEDMCSDSDDGQEEVEGEDNGYDSAVSNYDDARSEMGARSSREGSRSQIGLDAQSRSERRQSLKPIKRKPVERYDFEGMACCENLTSAASVCSYD